MLIVIGLAQFALLFVVSFSMIASAVCALGRPAVRAVLHRADAGVAVLGLAEGVHSVFVHAGHRERVHLRLRAVPEPAICRRCRRDCGFEEQLLYGVHAVMILVTFTVGVSARAVADQLDLLGSIGRVGPAGSHSGVLRDASCRFCVPYREVQRAECESVQVVLCGHGDRDRRVRR